MAQTGSSSLLRISAAREEPVKETLQQLRRLRVLRGGGVLPSPFLSPDAVICCSYFITVLLAIIGLEDAKLYITVCNKQKTWGDVPPLLHRRNSAAESQEIKAGGWGCGGLERHPAW